MRKVWASIFFVTLVLCTIVNAQKSDKLSSILISSIDQKGQETVFKAWIYFTDKGDNIEAKLNSFEENLLPHARKRRLRNRSVNNLVDFKDIPLNGNYMGQIRPLVNKIRHKSRWLNAVSVEASGEALEQIGTFQFVKKIDMVHSNKSPKIQEGKLSSSTFPKIQNFSLNYGPSFDQNAQINTVALHDSGYDGSGVIVAMLDAGFNNLQHESLIHLNILHTWDFAHGDSIVWDEPGQIGSGNHGTYTLSALAGYEPGKLIGPAYGASFLLGRTEIADSLGERYERHLEEDNWVAGAEWADSLGADIISSSLGYRYDFTHGELDYTWQDMDGNTAISTIGADIAAGRGILVITSAGNSGSPIPPVVNTIIAPTDGDSVLSIGAVDASGNRVSFSSMGPTADGRIKPDVMARGVATVCASASNPQGYLAVNGTSLSCPLVGGAAALVMQVNPTWSNMQVLEALRSTADRASNPDNSYGWGIIDAYTASLYDQPTGINENEILVADKFELYHAYPNPFNPTTTIRFSLPVSEEISLVVFNNLGQRVTTIFEGVKSAGEHSLVWDASQFASGVYLLRLSNSQGQKVRKLLLLK